MHIYTLCPEIYTQTPAIFDKQKIYTHVSHARARLLLTNTHISSGTYANSGAVQICLYFLTTIQRVSIVDAVATFRRLERVHFLSLTSRHDLIDLGADAPETRIDRGAGARACVRACTFHARQSTANINIVTQLLGCLKSRCRLRRRRRENSDSHTRTRSACATDCQTVATGVQESIILWITFYSIYPDNAFNGPEKVP